MSEGAEGAVLRAYGVSRRFGRREALRDVSLELGAGEVVALIGPNGAGKTTLLSILAGVLAPTAGHVSGGALAAGWVPQQTALYSKLTVAENLRLFARLERVPDVEAVVQAMLEQTGLTDRAAEPLARLSGGNRQRVNVAIGMLAAPQALLLDEPSSALDPRQRARLWEFVGGLARAGTGVLFSTHDVGEAAGHATRVLVLADGELLFAGPPGDLVAQARGESFEEAFVAFLLERGH